MAAGPGRQPFQVALWVASALGQLGKEGGQKRQGCGGCCILAYQEDLVSFQLSSNLHRAVSQGGQKAGVGQRA